MFPGFFIILFLAMTGSATPSFYTNNQLGQSVPLTNVQHREREELRKELLHLMGLPSHPKVKVNRETTQSASTFMYDLYATMARADETNGGVGGPQMNHSATELKAEHSDMIVSYVNLHRKVRFPRHERDRVFYFDFRVSEGEQLKAAELRLYKEAVAGDSSETFALSLYGIKVSSQTGAKSLELESSLLTHRSKSGWVTLDATQSAELWGFFPLLNSGLYLKVTNSTGHGVDPATIGIVGSKGPAEKQAFLVAYMESSTEAQRRRRSIRNKLLKDPHESISNNANPYFEHPSQNTVWNQGLCRWHNFYISFREIGFDHKLLIAPEGYYASFCAGKCQFPMDVNSNATNHAVMQMLVHTMRPETAPVPCCAPKDYSSISLLYYDEKSSVVLKKFKDMTVKSCGCQ